VKITTKKIKAMIMEAIAARLAESFPGSESSVGSPSREAQDAIIQKLSVGVQGAIFDILEEMSADEHIVELLSRAGEMSPEAEAVNAAILSGIRKGTENYSRKLDLMGGPKPMQAVVQEDMSALADRAVEAIKAHLRKAQEAESSGDTEEANRQRERIESLKQRLVSAGMEDRLAGLEIDNLEEAGRSSDHADAIAGHTSWSRQAGEDAHRAKLRAAQVADAKARLRKDRLAKKKAKKTGKPVESDAERRAKRYRNPEHYHEEKRRN
jgi:hypothetical protein